MQARSLTNKTLRNNVTRIMHAQNTTILNKLAVQTNK